MRSEGIIGPWLLARQGLTHLPLAVPKGIPALGAQKRGFANPLGAKSNASERSPVHLHAHARARLKGGPHVGMHVGLDQG
jgi:hypothetical protein